MWRGYPGHDPVSCAAVTPAAATESPRTSPRSALAPAVAACLGFALTLYLTRGLWFDADDWDFMVFRSDWSSLALLGPQNYNWHLWNTVVFTIFGDIWGFSTFVPFRILGSGLFAVVCFQVVRYAQVRGAGRLLLAGIALGIVITPGWEIALWPFQFSQLLSVACGLGALMLVDAARPGARRALAVAALLVVAMTASSAGPPMLVLYLGDRLLRSGRRRELLLALPALAIYGWWNHKWGSTSPNMPPATLEQFLMASRHTLELATGAVQSLVGLGGRPALGPAVGTAGVVALIAVITLRLVLPPRTDRVRVLALVGTMAVYWTLLWWGRNNMPNLPLQPRYLFITQVLMLLLMVELFARGRTAADAPEAAEADPGRRPGWLLAGTAALTVALLVASLPHLTGMRAGARKLRTESDQMRAQIVALSLLPTLERQTAPLFREARTRQLAAPAGPYFAQDGRFGIPLRTERDVQELRPVERAHLDGFLLGLTAAPAQAGVPMPEPSGAAPRFDAQQVSRVPGASACRRVVASGEQSVSFTLAPGQWITVQSGPASASRLQLHRYAPSGVPITTMELPAGSLYTVRRPLFAGRAPIQWRIASEDATLCTRGMG